MDSKTDLAVPVTESTDLTSLGEITGVAERPKTLGQDLTGTEDIGANELRLPRLAQAQGLSPQMTPGNAQHIPGLGMFEFFNDLTGEKYGNGPIVFVPVRRDIRRIEFVPRAEGGGVVDMDVPANDQRLKWTVDAEGKRQPPRATSFVEFIVLLLLKGHAPEPIVLSIKGTNKHNRRAADQLTTFIKLRNATIYSGLYTITSSSVPHPATSGTYGIPVIKNAGFVPKDTPAGTRLYEFAEKFAASLQGKTIVVDREPGSDDVDTDFPHGASAGEADVPGGM